MKFLNKLIKSLCNPRVWPFLGLGIASQAPVNLIGGTLKYWFSTEGVDLSKIGLFSLVLIPYAVKFLWAPLVDQINLPLSKYLGRKKTWGLVCQLLMIGFLFLLSFSHPAEQIGYIFSLCLGIAFMSATQDIVTDALRIDTLDGDELKQGTTLYLAGCRLGQLAAVAGMILLSAHIAWQYAYQISSLLVVIGFVSFLGIREQKTKKEIISLEEFVIKPLKDMISRSRFGTLCLFVIMYRLCNCMLGPMAYPFYYDIGFTAEQISIVSGTFGVFVTMGGVFLGGLVMMKFKYRPLLFWLGCLEIFTSLAFAWLAWLGPSMSAFFAVILFDNILAGMGGAVWVVYLSNFCCKKFSATQYAFLSAINMVPLSILAGASGWLADKMGWPLFFTFTGWLMIPALWMIHKNWIGLKPNQK
ncbi:MAG: MFS transporter [Alphaproteobacteria bacterium]|nr:MFS transporter [Alphaproteobacteria bacterium]